MPLQIDFALLFFSVFFSVYLPAVQGARTFNVREYGAIADGRTDNRKAFVRAWTDACNRNGVSIVYVPRGVYMLGAVEFSGPCKGPIIFSVNGRLKAPMGASSDAENWIAFQYVNNLVMKGGGTLDGQGPSAWSLNDCQTNPNCKQLPTTLKFDFVTNSRIKRIRSVNSKNTHIGFFGCNNVNVSKVSILAPDDSPNTDGIKIGSSTHIRISRSKISTGDDCVAILSGSSRIDISNVHCGPGHGISIGSLGKYQGEKNVDGVSVRKCLFRETENGVRIKTWESPIRVTVSNILFQDILMDRVLNPIIIDQTYCPISSCNQQTASHVQIRDVTYRNIWGTSRSPVAVSMECSKQFPCQNVVMTDVVLAKFGTRGSSKSLCSYVNGRFFGKQHPRPCF
ncbi:CTC-interacting domain 9 [Hibiscus syriacus]|uniref:Polygalacturonase n=2 Tax=Hibiscus syriacus TaxID=106335 RepID=A0A6A3ANF3_HIBSY|nr:CTC-interacting domain 9 [Hibiscus syriacus]